MRPRLDCRGEPQSDLLKRPERGLLQCGHGSIAVENTMTRTVSPHQKPASMRPRLDCRGERQVILHDRLAAEGFNAATARLPWRTGLGRKAGGAGVAASMRPRLDCRGEHSTSYSPIFLRARLQCGHGSIAVENEESRPGFGQGVRLASMRPRLDCRGEPVRRPPRTTPSSLQCGHGSIAVENLGRFSQVALRRKPSMRPRLDCRGELSWLRSACGPAVSFNAATARLPWRIHGQRKRWADSHRLQCGHGSIAVENPI